MNRQSIAPPLPVLLVPFAIVGSYHALWIEELFWRRWPPLDDAGWFGWLLARGGWTLGNPTSIAAKSFFAIHTSPGLVPFWLLSRLFGLGHVDALALFSAIGFGALAAAAGWALWEPGKAVAAISCSVLFAFQPLLLSIAAYPHIEIAIAGFGCLCLTALASGRPRLAAVMLILAASIREDGGAHVGALLLTAWAWKRMHTADTQAAGLLLRFGLAGFAWTLIALAIQHLAFGDLVTLKAAYAGDSTWAQFADGTLGARLWTALVTRLPVTLLLSMIAVAALVLRDPRPALGIVATLPWLLLNVASTMPMKPLWAGYVAFPVVLAAFWPLVADRLLGGRTIGAGRRQAMALLFLWGVAVPLAVKQWVLAEPITAASVEPNLKDVFLFDWLTERAARTDAIRRIDALKSEIPEIGADSQVAALLPNAFRPRDMVWAPADYGDPTRRGVLFFRNASVPAPGEAEAAKAGLARRYRFPGTPIILAVGAGFPDTNLAGLDALDR